MFTFERIVWFTDWIARFISTVFLLISAIFLWEHIATGNTLLARACIIDQVLTPVRCLEIALRIIEHRT